MVRVGQQQSRIPHQPPQAGAEADSRGRDRCPLPKRRHLPGIPLCPSPDWQRTPMRVTFEPAGTAKQTFATRGHVADLMAEGHSDEQAAQSSN